MPQNNRLRIAIQGKLRRGFVGPPGITRKELLEYLYDRKILIKGSEEENDDNDRTIRRILAQHPQICTAGNGYYWARKYGHPEDVQAALDFIQRTYVAPLEAKIRKTKLAFPGYYPEEQQRDPDQMKLRF